MNPLDVLAKQYGAPPDKVYAIYRALSAYATDQQEALDMTTAVVKCLWGDDDELEVQ